MKMNRLGWMTKETRLIILTIILLSFLGCASVGLKVHKMEKGFIDDFSKHKDMKVGLVFKSTHLGSSGRVILFGVLGYIKSSEEKEYARDLDMKYCKVIEEVIIIKGKAPFQLKTEQLKDVPEIEDIFPSDTEDEKRGKRERNREAIKQFIESNGLFAALYVKPFHKDTAGLKKKVALSTKWIMYDHDGEESINIRTYYTAEKALEMFPNTLDPQYEATFLKLFEMSMNDFISVLSENK